MNKKSIMMAAWRMAKQGAYKFGGNAKEYISEALKQAWKAAKIREEIELERLAYDKQNHTITPSLNKNSKNWIAEITGTHPKWKFDRRFINQETVKMEEGKVYNWTAYKGDKVFGTLQNGQLVILEENEVKGLVA